MNISSSGSDIHNQHGDGIEKGGTQSSNTTLSPSGDKSNILETHNEPLAGTNEPTNHVTEDGDSGIDMNGGSCRLSGPASPFSSEDKELRDVDAEKVRDLRPAEASEQAFDLMPRRSTRSRKVPANYEDEYIIPASQNFTKTSGSSSRPKRKAASVAQKSFTGQQDLDLVTETICAPMVSEELRNYKGWVELESEPSFFQAMLHEVGAPGLKITELYGLEDALVRALPKPTYGLIFLFPYEETGEQNAEERQDCPNDLWFANQTTANGCATVALLNIAMNIPNLSYGPELQRFKEQTKPLSYLERGQALDTNDFIRCIHNSVARRTQLLNEDLMWKNRQDEQEKAQRKTKRIIRAVKSKARASVNIKKSSGTMKKTDLANAPNHYIAYVPHNGKVWEFDGLEDKPVCLGPYEGDIDKWTMAAVETIQLRMAAGFFSSGFNLLALCATPLQSLEDRLVQSLAAAQRLEQEYREDGESDDPSWPHPSISKLYPPEKLESLNHLTWEMAANIGPTEAFLEKLSQPNFNKEKAISLMAELIVEQNDIEADLAAEIDSQENARLEYESRQRDFTPFIHQFLLALAETGQLEETINNFVEGK